MPESLKYNCIGGIEPIVVSPLMPQMPLLDEFILGPLASHQVVVHLGMQAMYYPTFITDTTTKEMLEDEKS